MTLWLLRPRRRDDIPPGKPYPWINTSNAYFGFVVRADTEKAARLLAEDEARERGAWLDPDYTDCEKLNPNGPNELILWDFSSG